MPAGAADLTIRERRRRAGVPPHRLGSLATMFGRHKTTMVEAADALPGRATPMAWDVFRKIYPNNLGPWYTQPAGIETRRQPQPHQLLQQQASTP